MKIKEYIERCHKNAREHGFWDDVPLCDSEKISEMKHYYNSKLMLIVSELGEACEALREERFGVQQKDTFEDEIADVFIRLFDLCGGFKIDLEKQLERKMKFNEKRPYKHKKNF